MHVGSVQVGSARLLQIGERSVETGIDKTPVGQIDVHIAGVATDAVVNTKHHGGPDQAVYVYSAEDYAWWESQLDRSLEPGTFGENLTVSGAPSLIRVGDRIQIGDALLEVTAPRIPCATFAARMGEAGWIRRFRDANRPGFYCRVLQTGTVRPGDHVKWTAAPEANVTLEEMVEHFYATDVPLPDVHRVLASPIAIRSRTAYEARLAASDV
jgi:MOSC domain-containing protein YiiM